MPVVLVPRPKKVDGREVPIFEELGGRLFNPELEEDVEWLRQIHASLRPKRLDFHQNLMGIQASPAGPQIEGRNCDRRSRA